jgi:hypothetical protein
MVQRRSRGHVRQRRNGKLQVLVYAGRDPVTGRQRYLAETVATPDEAERTLTRLLHQVDEQRNPNTRATVGHLLDRWLEVADLELSTRHGYQGLIERKVRPRARRRAPAPAYRRPSRSLLRRAAPARPPLPALRPPGPRGQAAAARRPALPADAGRT